MAYGGKPSFVSGPDPTSDDVESMTLDQFKNWIMGREWRRGYHDPDFGHFIMSPPPPPRREKGIRLWPEKGDILNGELVK